MLGDEAAQEVIAEGAGGNLRKFLERNYFTQLMPIWKSEPKKYGERLQKGDYDWSHIAMRYWPERVREKCKTNKSFAIAHGHEEWYEG